MCTLRSAAEQLSAGQAPHGEKTQLGKTLLLLPNNFSHMEGVFSVFNEHAYGIKRLFENSSAARHVMTRSELDRLLHASGFIPVGKALYHQNCNAYICIVVQDHISAATAKACFHRASETRNAE